MKKLILFLLIFIIKIIQISSNSAENTLRFLENAEQQLNLTKNTDLILVVGNTGAGKSVLVHYVAGDYSRIFVEKPSRRGQPLVIRDELDPVKEETSSTQSRTLIPEIITDEEKYVWVDCPGFADTRNSTFEIASTFLIKTVIESAAKLKLVMVLDYNSLIRSGSRQDFDQLLTRTTQLIPNVPYFADSVNLVVSKVPSINEFGEDILDDDLKALATEFMEDHRAYLVKKGSSKLKIELIDALSKNSTDEYYPKITAFWRPNKIGAFNTIPNLIKGRVNIRKSISKNSLYQNVKISDFGFPLTADALIEIHKIITHADADTLKILNVVKNHLVTELQKQIESTENLVNRMKLIDLGLNITQPKYKNDEITANQLAEYYQEFISKFNVTVIDVKLFDRVKVHQSNRQIFVSMVQNKDDYQEESNSYFDLASEVVDLLSKYEEKTQFAIEDTIQLTIKSIKFTLLNIEGQTMKELQRKLESSPDVQSKFELFKHGKDGSWAKSNAKTVSEWAQQIRDIVNTFNLTTVDTVELTRIEREEALIELLKPICRIETDFESISIPTIATNYPVKMHDWYAFLTQTYDQLIDFKVQRSVNTFKTNGEYESLIASAVHYSPNEAQMTEFQTMVDTILKPPQYECKGDVLNIKGNIVRSSDIKTDSCSSPDKVTKINVFVVHTFYVDGDLNLSPLNEVELHILAHTWNIRQKSVFNLSGKSGKEHEPLKTVETAGKHGNPGENSGNFFGWATEVINGDLLTVELNGGSGSNGQDGTGNVDRFVDFKETIEYCRGLSVSASGCANELVRRLSDGKDFTHSGMWSGHDRDCQGRKGFQSLFYPDGCCGGAGEGGAGGAGGKPGYYSFLLRGNPSQSLPSEIKKDGINGVNGQKAKKCLNMGKVLRICDMETGAFNVKMRVKPIREENSDFCHYNPIRDDSPIKKPNPPKKMDATPTIVDYKNYLIEIIDVPAFLRTIRETQQALELSSDISTTDKFTSFAMEANKLEKQFYKSTDKFKLLPFHENLLRRIEDYVENSNEILSTQNKQILALLYSVIFSKTTEIRSSHSSDLIIDIEEFFKLTVENIEDMKKLGETKVIDEERKKYNDEIAVKRKEANDFIKNDIEPEVQKMFTKLDDEMDKTIKEVKSMQTDAIEEIKKKEEDYKIMRRNVQIRKVSRIFRFVGGLASLIPSGGPIVSQAIDTATEWDENDLKDPKKRGNFNVPMGIKNIRAQLDHDKTETIEAIESIFEGLKNVMGRDAEFDKKIKDLTKKIDEVKRDSSKDESIDVAEQTIEYVKGYLAKMTEHATDDMKDMKKALKKASDGLTVAVSSISQFKKMHDDEDSLSEFAKAVNDDKDTLKSLLLFEKQIYADLLPTINALNIHLSNVSGSLDEKSLVALDVMHWKVRNTMRAIQKKLGDAFAGFTTENDISNCLLFINEAMSVLMNIYDRIRTYEEHTRFANYLTNIQNVDFEKIFIEDVQLRISISELQYNLHANMILGQQYRAVNAFKQAVFPFAANYLNLFQLPESLAIDNSSAVISFATKQVQTLSKRIREFNSTVINENDQSIHIEYFTRDPGSAGPFYVWKNSEVRAKIEQLFAGKKIYLLADISDSARRNAVKFKVIDLIFRTENNTVNDELNEILQHFSASLLHMGESNYRCNDNIYTMDTRPLNITYSYSKRNGEHISENQAYIKLKTGPPLLSPYTLWTLQLLKGDFKKLQPFVDLVDIELHGYGQYVDGGVSACNKDLAKYYTLKEY